MHSIFAVLFTFEKLETKCPVKYHDTTVKLSACLICLKPGFAERRKRRRREKRRGNYVASDTHRVDQAVGYNLSLWGQVDFWLQVADVLVSHEASARECQVPILKMEIVGTLECWWKPGRKSPGWMTRIYTKWTMGDSCWLAGCQAVAPATF